MSVEEKSLDRLVRVFDDDEQVSELLKSLPKQEAGVAIWKHGSFCTRVVDLLRDAERAVTLHAQCWESIGTAMRTSEEERERSSDLVAFFIDHDVLVLLQQEFERYQGSLATDKHRTEALERALTCLTQICLVEDHAHRVVSNTSLVGLLVATAQAETPQMLGVLSLICITNLAIHASKTHVVLHENNVLDMCQSLITRYLHPVETEDEQELDCALSACFIVCRMLASQPDGANSGLAHNEASRVYNACGSVIVDKLFWILQQVLLAGPNKSVLGSYWNPANIVFDVSILCQNQDILKSMGRFVPLVVQALESRSKGNPRLVKLCLQVLIALASVDEMSLVNDRLYTLLDARFVRREQDAAIKALAMNLEHVLSPPVVVPPRKLTNDELREYRMEVWKNYRQAFQNKE